MVKSVMFDSPDLKLRLTQIYPLEGEAHFRRFKAGTTERGNKISTGRRRELTSLDTMKDNILRSNLKFVRHIFIILLR